MKLSDFFLSNDFNDRKKLAVITLANRKFAKLKNSLKYHKNFKRGKKILNFVQESKDLIKTFTIDS